MMAWLVHGFEITGNNLTFWEKPLGFIWGLTTHNYSQRSAITRENSTNKSRDLWLFTVTHEFYNYSLNSAGTS